MQSQGRPHYPCGVKTARHTKIMLITYKFDTIHSIGTGVSLCEACATQIDHEYNNPN